MFSQLPFLFIAFFLLLAPVQERDQETSKKPKLPSAKSIINKYVMALGGYEQLESRESAHWKYKVTSSKGDNYTFEAFQIEGQYFCRTEKNSELWYTRGVWTDGTRNADGLRNGFAWHLYRDSLLERQDDELQEYLRRRTFVTSSPHWLRDYASVKCVGVEFVNDTECYQLQLIDHNDTVIDLFFDAKTGLLRRRKCIEPFNNTTQLVERDMSDYVKVGDTLIAMNQTIKWDNIVKTYEFEFHNFNVKIPKGTFEIPPAIQRQIDAYQKAKEEAKLVAKRKAKDGSAKQPEAKKTKAEQSTTKPDSVVNDDSKK